MAFPRAISSEAGLRLLSYPLGSNIFTRTACCSVGVALPVYSTFKAIEKKDHKEQEKWLSYWAVYGCYSLAEIYSDRFISWIPLYHHMKFAFLVWLQLPSIEGSRHLYEKYLRPVLVKHQTKMDQVGFIYSKMIKFMNSHQHEVDLLKALVQRSVFAVYNMVKGVIHPASRRHPSAIKDEDSDDDQDTALISRRRGPTLVIKLHWQPRMLRPPAIASASDSKSRSDFQTKAFLQQSEGPCYALA